WYAKSFNQLKEPEKRDLIEKIKAIGGQLSPEEILSILDRIEDKSTAGYLSYQMGVNNAEEEKYEEALKVLSAFVEKIPEHEYAPQAKDLIAEIKKKFAYNRFTIGCLLPLSGPYKTYGKRVLRGIELAMNHHSSQNIDKPFRVIIKDTGSDPVKATQAVIELYDDGVAAIMGPIITAESAAFAAQKRGIPIITLTQKEDITDIGDYVFRNFFTPKTQVKALVSYVVKELGLKRFAILYPDENYGTTFMNLFWDEVTAHGANIVGVESYDSRITDFADQIKKLIGLYYPVPKDLRDVPIQPDSEDPIIDFDAIFIPDAPRTAGLIIPQLAYHDIKETYLLGTNLWHSEVLIKMARRFVQGALMPDGFFAGSASVHVTNFVEMFQEAFGREPEYIEAVAYDTAMLLFQLVGRPDVKFRSTLNKELRKLKNFSGVTSLTSFDDNGDALKRLYLLRVEGEQFIELGQH
ncbi:MAG: penicillin-binding protein activator, partial [Desulfobacterales bacterium]